MEHLTSFIMHHWVHCFALLIVFIFIVIDSIQRYRNQGHYIAPQDAVLLINHEQACVIDLRTSALFEKEHILDSIQANQSDHLDDKFKSYKEKPLIFVAQQEPIAELAATLWKKSGFNRVYVLKGGLEAWREAGFPLIKPSTSHNK